MRCFKGSCLVVSFFANLRLVKVKVDVFLFVFCARGFLCDDAFVTAPSRALSGHRVAHRDENEPVFVFVFFLQSSPAAGLEAQAPAARACVITKAVRISLSFCAPLLAAGSPEACSKCCCPPLHPTRVSANRFIGFKLLVNLVSGSAEWVSHFRSASHTPLCTVQTAGDALCTVQERGGEERRCRGP